MLNFTSFLIEEAQTMQVEKPLVHLMHPEDAIIDHGHDGVGLAANFLDAGHHLLSGHKSDMNWSVKHDGISTVFGHDPHDKQFFVASKSIFNKNPKINKTPEDIINNHGDKPELADKLLTALKHLPKIMPKSGGIFQGDFMHDKKSRELDKSHVHFQPNTIRYSAPKASAEGATIKNSHMGIAIHTHYSPEGIPFPLDDKMRKRFESHPDVHNIHTGLKIKSNQYTAGDLQKYLTARDAATKHYQSMTPDAFDAALQFVPQMHKYINHEVRREGQPSAQGFMEYLNQLHDVRMGGIRNQKWAKSRIMQHSGDMSHILGHANNFDKVFKLHNLLGQAKNALIEPMVRNLPYTHSINGQPAHAEGIVAVAPTGSAAKFVNREMFSKMNFLHGKFNEKL